MSATALRDVPFRVVVLSGPSGAGKTTIVERVIAQSPVPLIKSISATTRPPRAGEVDGQAYYFLPHEEFQARRCRGDFLETAEVYGVGYWYGTLRSEVDRARGLGGWSFLEIDVEGALNVHSIYPDAVTIFLCPPSLEVLEQRLRARKTDSEAVIERRLKQVAAEMSLAERYRYRVVNDQLEAAVQQIIDILRSEASVPSSVQPSAAMT